MLWCCGKFQKWICVKEQAWKLNLLSRFNRHSLTLDLRPSANPTVHRQPSTADHQPSQPSILILPPLYYVLTIPIPISIPPSIFQPIVLFPHLVIRYSHAPYDRSIALFTSIHFIHRFSLRPGRPLPTNTPPRVPTL